MFAQQFDIQDRREENKNRSIGAIVSVAVHGLLVLLLFFMYISTPDPPYQDNAGGMTVNYGTSDVGGDEQQQYTTVPVDVKEVADASPTAPAEAATAPDDLETQTTEDAAVVETKTEIKKKVEKPNPEAVFKPKTNKTTSTPEAPKPQVDKNALFSPGAAGKPNHSKGDGGGAQSGDRGDPNGDPGSKNYEGGGTGNGLPNGGNGLGGDKNVRLAGRKIKTKPKFSYDCDARGKVVMNIKVNKGGKVVNADFSQSGSTTADECLISRARQLALQYSFDESSGEADIQKGSISFDFRER